MHRNTNRTRFSTFTLFCLLVLGTLVFLAACGNNSSSNSTSTGSAPATATSGTSSSTNDYSGGYGYGGGKYGNTTPTATTAITGPTQTVTITTDSSGAFAFSPQMLTIKAGTTVIWKNTTQAPHTVTSNDGKTFNSGDANPVAPNASFNFKFTSKGTFAYHCDFHPYMKATIVVQ